MMAEAAPLPASSEPAAVTASQSDGHTASSNNPQPPVSQTDTHALPPPPSSSLPVSSVEFTANPYPYPEEAQSVTASAPGGTEMQSAATNTSVSMIGDANSNRDVEVEAGSTTMAERTLVEGADSIAKSHARGESTSSFSLPLKEEYTYAPKKSMESQRGRPGSASATGATWDPLKSSDKQEEDTDSEKMETQDKTVIMEEGDVVDSRGRLLHVEGEVEEGKASHPSVASRRASHLRLDLKSSSPMPWEQVEPPLDNNLKAIAGYYSPVTSHKFRTLQNSGGPRPLIPKSSYYFGPPPPDSAYGTPPMGQIGVHRPREVLRVERDYTGGELIQFAPIYPLELEGRITPTHFLESVNAINELLISAHSLRHSFVDNMLAIFSLQISKLFVKSHFEKASSGIISRIFAPEMLRLQHLVDDLNTQLYNPVGLNILWPRNVAFLYLEIEYY
ncbi:hypothetical protein GALMADRAFT_82682 [Galerina marginata CBS 339.88]|uniref:Ras modification protein ERF4 n=1 Tax=Galerina marginata (strain CBS 339.88) TaxID=685588 RepID=A0A067TXM0_GALM3|nr:hypothetical protein GALMADRAFT_82682 [Galerina marginata CBS 339.88]